MITVVKINVLTDDASVPAELRERLTQHLRALIQDDPEGVEHAIVSLEWKCNVMNRDYMEALQQTPHAERIRLPRETRETRPVPKAASRKRAKR